MYIYTHYIHITYIIYVEFMLIMQRVSRTLTHNINNRIYHYMLCIFKCTLQRC